MARGTLRLYLGAAPGVGKTYAMLNEGWRRKERGTDVVVGWVQEHGRPQTDAQIRDLEIVPRRRLEYRGQSFEEMDLDGILERKPQLALVDELAHTNVPGCKHPKRYQDVEELLEAGINVISTINLQHLESLNDVVETITGVAQHETVPDPFVRNADQIELVDMAPEALRRRLAHGNIYKPERVDAALSNYFRAGNLTALRELALLWVADRVDEELSDYRERHHIAGAWETKERVLVSLTGSRGSAILIRRAARMAMRSKAELVGVHVRSDDTVTARGGTQGLVQNRTLLDDLGGRYVEVVGADVAPALVEVARAENATQLVMGATHRSRLTEFVRGSVINSVIRAAGGALDVHVIATEAELRHEDGSGAETPAEPDRGRPGSAGRGRGRRRLLSPLSFRRRLAALLIGVVGFPLLTMALITGRGHSGLSTALSAYLVLVVAVAATGGIWPAALAAVAGFVLAHYYFARPIHTFAIADARDILALVMFLVTAGVVSLLVDYSARTTATANQARSDARMLARVAGRMVAPEENTLPDILQELVMAFRLQAVAILRSGEPTAEPADPSAEGVSRDATGGSWSLVAGAGEPLPRTPDDAGLQVPLTNREVLALRGPGLTAEDRAILTAFAAQLSSALQRARLDGEVVDADGLAGANRMLSDLLAAASRDLRKPLSVVKASASALLEGPQAVDPEAASDLLATIDDESHHLDRLVQNLLDLSRLRAGSTEVQYRSTDIARAIEAAIASLAAHSATVHVEGTDALSPVVTDPVLLERALANLIDNALAHAGGAGLHVEVGTVTGWIDIRVVDRGPGIPPAERARILQPFGQLGDPRHADGVGLGLAVAQGFVEAIGGELEIEDTAGGGCTMVIRIPESEPADAAP
ncbi:MAG: sensor histidine kinase [Acidimicrobiales bacterium]